MARRVAVAGLVLVGLMQVWFALTGADRPPAYGPVQWGSALGSFASAWGLARVDRGGAGWLAAGFGVNFVGRLLQLALSLTRLPIVLNVALLTAFGAGLLVGILWANGRPQPGRLVAILVGLAAIHFIALLIALGRLEAAIGLALGTAGYAMAAAFADTRETPRA